MLGDRKKLSTDELENLKGNKKDTFNWCGSINLLNRQVTHRDGNPVIERCIFLLCYVMV